jgi:hypothetical protein
MPSGVHGERLALNAAALSPHQLSKNLEHYYY